jgi:adenylate cyclase
MPEEQPQARLETRKLAAIMFTDMVGFSRQMGANEARMLRLLEVHNQLIQQAVTEHHGHVIKTIGDAFLVDFPSVVHAVQCAQQIQGQFRAHNNDKEKTEQIHVRIGIHSGDIVQKDGDVFGDGVNIASRLQTLAEPDTICISQVVYQEVSKKLNLGTIVPLGKPQLKNIAERFAVYALLPAPPTGLRQTLQVQRLKFSRRLRPSMLVFMSGVLVAGLIASQFSFFSSIRTPQSPIRNQEALPLPDKPSIVVLPFTNMSNDPEQDYFSDGITEDITSDLSKISSLFVIARNSAFTYKGKAVKVQDVSREMGVRYVLEGSVRKSDNQVRVTTQLIDATTGGHLWSERYDRPLTDIFALQDEIVQKIVTTLKLQITLTEQGFIVRKTTDNLEAYDYYLRGRNYSVRATREAIAQARQMYERAIALDPQYAEVYAWLGGTYWLEWVWRWSVAPQTLERAFELAQKAAALDDSLPLAHSVLSLVYLHKKQSDQALTEGERAIALDANNADSYAYQADVLNMAGRAEEALKMTERAMRLNPRYPPWYLVELGWAYRLTGRYAEAIVALKEVVSRNPDHFSGHVHLAISYLEQWTFQQNPDAQTLEQALAAAQRIVALNDSSFLGHMILGTVSLWQKQYERALVEMKRSVVLAPNDASSHASLALVLSHVDKSEDALRAAEQALRSQFFGTVNRLLFPIGTAYYLAGRPEEAIAPLKQYLTRYPNFLGAHLHLAAVHSELGKDAEAQAEAAEVLRLNPKFSLEVHKERVPIKDPATLERHIAALRKAGLK